MLKIARDSATQFPIQILFDLFAERFLLKNRKLVKLQLIGLHNQAYPLPWSFSDHDTHAVMVVKYTPNWTDVIG